MCVCVIENHLFYLKAYIQQQQQLPHHTKNEIYAEIIIYGDQQTATAKRTEKE